MRGRKTARRLGAAPGAGVGVWGVRDGDVAVMVLAFRRFSGWAGVRLSGLRRRRASARVLSMQTVWMSGGRRHPGLPHPWGGAAPGAPALPSAVSLYPAPACSSRAFLLPPSGRELCALFSMQTACIQEGAPQSMPSFFGSGLPLQKRTGPARPSTRKTVRARPPERGAILLVAGDKCRW